MEYESVVVDEESVAVNAQLLWFQIGIFTEIDGYIIVYLVRRCAFFELGNCDVRTGHT